MLTRKHFEAIAAVIRRKIEAGITREEAMLAAQVFIEVASYDNPRFDRVRFLKAAGL
jgi:hypothetical protein